MFKLDLSATFWAPVRFDTPATNGGKREVHEFQAEFPRMTEDDLQALSAQVIAEAWPDRKTAAHLLRNWAEVLDRHGNPLPCTDDNKAAAFNQAGVAAAVVAAFRAAQPRAALGN